MLSRIIPGMFKIFLLSTFIIFLLLGITLFFGMVFGYSVVPAVQVLYSASSLDWLIRARVAVHGIASIALMLMGVLMLASANFRIHPDRALRASALGVAMLMTSTWNITIIGLVVYGGAWHFASFLIGGIEAIVMIIVSAIVFYTQAHANSESNESKN
jgi:hypothetical protein